MSNLTAFLTTIAMAEGTPQIRGSEDGYKALVGGGLFQSYADHPRQRITVNSTLKSTAAGRYQILARIYDAYKEQLKLPDFSPESQDAIAVQLMQETGAYDAVLDGKFEKAVKCASSRWASLPGNSYGQPTRTLTYLKSIFTANGGVIA